MEKMTKKSEVNTESKFSRRGRLEHWHIMSALLAVYDVLAIIIAFFLALWVRFDCNFSMIPADYFTAYYQFVLIYAVVAVFVFWRMHLYNSIWRFASYNELIRVVIATGITFVIHCVGITIIKRMPLSYYLFGILIQFVLVIGVRFSYRFILLERSRRDKDYEESKKKRILIVGAGEAGLMIMRDVKHAKETTDVVKCFIDDNPNSWGRFIDGIPVVGGRNEIAKAVATYRIDKIFIAIPSATAKQKQEILEICKETGCELKNLPGMYQLYTGEVKIENMQEVSVEDLLERDPIKVNMEAIYEYIQGKVCMITGGGGSIGSELARQVAAHNPKQLILFDIYENNVYDIQQELKKKYPELDLITLIGSVRDSRKLVDVFEQYRPEIVYHAAAHKHVPLMEDSPAEAVKNNAIGTYKTAYAAMLYGCKRFVLISTDKAVNPTNIMGASKRLCEMIVQSFDQKIKEGKAEAIPLLFTHSVNKEDVLAGLKDKLKDAKTEFVAVRFGNVLGSNGSVIPLFKKQIAEGGPVTVTHPDIIRYFMTIPEAVSLVMQAGVNASGGEIFVLDMGSPVKIDTLARNLIKLSGFKPDIDIKVEYTGLRPGEKLYEEKLMAEEGLEVTENELIHIGKPIPFDTDAFLKQLEELMNIAYMNSDETKAFVAKMVNTYKPEGM